MKAAHNAPRAEDGGEAAEGEASMAPKLIYRTAQGQLATLPLLDKRIHIGRDSSCELRFLDVLLTSVHCCVFRQGTEFVVEDLRSANHTFINDSDAAIDSHELRDRDLIRCGAQWILFRNEEGDRDAALEARILDESQQRLERAVAAERSLKGLREERDSLRADCDELRAQLRRLATTKVSSLEQTLRSAQSELAEAKKAQAAAQTELAELKREQQRDKPQRDKPQRSGEGQQTVRVFYASLQNELQDIRRDLLALRGAQAQLKSGRTTVAVLQQAIDQVVAEVDEAHEHLRGFLRLVNNPD